jgi:hypothetical protein
MSDELELGQCDICHLDFVEDAPSDPCIAARNTSELVCNACCGHGGHGIPHLTLHSDEMDITDMGERINSFVYSMIEHEWIEPGEPITLLSALIDAGHDDDDGNVIPMMRMWLIRARDEMTLGLTQADSDVEIIEWNEFSQMPAPTVEALEHTFKTIALARVRNAASQN